MGISTFNPCVHISNPGLKAFSWNRKRLIHLGYMKWAVLHWKTQNTQSSSSCGHTRVRRAVHNPLPGLQHRPCAAVPRASAAPYAGERNEMMLRTYQMGIQAVLSCKILSLIWILEKELHWAYTIHMFVLKYSPLTWAWGTNAEDSVCRVSYRTHGDEHNVTQTYWLEVNRKSVVRNAEQKNDFQCLDLRFEVTNCFLTRNRLCLNHRVLTVNMAMMWFSRSELRNYKGPR